MPTVVADRVKQYTTTSGTGSISFSGTIEGYKAFSDVLTSGDQTFYCVLDGANGETAWEVGIGTFDGSSLSRDTVLSSSTGSKISLSGNISTIFITYPAPNSVFTDGNNRLGIGTSSPSYTLDVFGHDAWIQATGVIVGASGIVIGDHGISPGINALSDARVLGTPTTTYLLDINIGNSGIYLGNQTQTKITSGGKSIHIGEQAGSGTTTGFSNVAIGYQAGKNITTGKRNVAIGAEVYPNGDDNHDNVFIGFQSADSASVGNYSIGIGAYAGYSEQGSNVNVGYKAGNSLWTYPINTTAIGYQSLNRAHIVTPHGANTMQYSVAVGSEAGYESYGAYGSTYLGAMAGYQGPGVGSVCIGFQAGRGISNIGIHDHLFIANNEPASNGTLIKGLFNTKEVAIGKTDINVSGVGTLQVYPKQATSKGIVVVSAASQSAPLMELKDSASAIIATMTPSGVLNAYGFVASGDISVDGKMIFNDADGSASINLKSPDSISSTYTLNLPSGIGVAGQSLHTNADGYTYWAVPAGGGTMSSFVISDGSTTQTVVDGNTVTFSPVSNRTTTAVSATDTLTIGLADDITVNRVAASGLGVMSASGIDVTSSGVWFHDLDRSTMITMRAHDTVSASYNFYLPSGVGTSTQVLKTDGAGTSYWDASDINSLTDVSFGGTNLSRTLIIGNAGPGATPVTGSLAADCEDNLAIGYLALNSITEGDGNLALGYNNLTGLTTGYTNVALGHNVAGAGAVTGYDNVAIGQSSMHSLTAGVRNIALGFSSLYGSTDGEYNISLGAMSQFYANDGDHNIAIGYASLYGNVDGSTTTGNNYNIGLGFETLKDITTGDRNIGIGYRAGLSLTSDSYMLYIASDAPASNGSLIKGDMTNKYLAVGKADVTLSTDPATFQVYVNAATDKGVVIQGAASQSDDLSSWKTSAGSIVAGMTPSGVLNTHGIVASGTGLRMHRVTPVVTADTLYNVGGALYFNGSALAGGVSVADLNYVSGVAVYASGESGGGGVTAGELAGVSGMVVYSSGQAIANESDIVAVSGIANYSSGIVTGGIPTFANMYVDEYIYHNGDTDTYIRLRGDQFDFVAGNLTFLTLDESAGVSPDTVTVNGNAADIDFVVKGDNDETLIRTDAANDKVGIGTGAPAYKLDVFGNDAWLQASGVIVGASGVVLASNTPATTSNTLYNVGGSLYFNGSALASAGASSEATYASGQAIANESDIVAVSGIANYASGQAIANESDIVATSGIANYASGQANTNKTNIATNVTNIATNTSRVAYASGQAIDNESDIVAVSGIANYASGQAGGGISWDGSTANGVATFKDGDEATVESNLTFDGSTLTVTGDVDATGYIYVAQRITHKGDNDTYIDFNDDEIRFKVGGKNLFAVTEGTVEQIVVNDIGNNADFRVESQQNANLIFSDGSTDRVGIGTATPAYGLDVVGAGASGIIQASGVTVGASGVILMSNTPAVVTNTLYNVGGTLYFNGSQLASAGGASAVAQYASGQAIANESDIVASSGVAAYASGQAIANESDIVAVSGISNYASGQAIANESDIVATSGIANYASGQAIANENDIVAVSGISNYASGQAIENEGLIAYASGNTANISFGSNAEGDILYHNGTKFIRLAKGTDNHVLTMNGNVPNWEAAAAGSASAEATYASGQAIANESDIVAVSGISNYASGQAIANEDDIVAVSGIANYASGQTNGKMTDFIISDGSTTQTVADGNTITFAATSNETTVAVSATDTVTIGLPNDVTLAGNLTVAEYVYHAGDANTYLRLRDDNINFVAGGWSAFKLEKSTGKIQLNNSNVDLDVQIMADNAGVILHADAAENRIGLNTSTPAYGLDVVGAGASGVIQASGVKIGASGIFLGGTAVTATAAELNYLDITTLGTAAASKAMTWAADSTWTAAGGTCANLGTVTTVDINGGTIDGATIATSDVTVGSSKTLDVSGGTLTTSAAQKQAIVAGADGAAIDNCVIGGSTAAAGTFTTITANTSVVPDAAGGADLGSTSAEWGDIYIADDKKIKLGNGQDASIEYDEDGTDTLSISGVPVTFNKASKHPIKANADGATVTFDLNEANVHTVTLGGNRTFATSNATVGQRFIIRIKQDGSTRTVTWGTGSPNSFGTITWAGGSAPDLTDGSNKADIIGFICTAEGTPNSFDGFVVAQNI